MKIGVISDTHIPVSSKCLPTAVAKHFKGVDLIIHAGDIVNNETLESLSKIAKTIAVCGNMDSTDLRKSLHSKEVIKAGKFKIAYNTIAKWCRYLEVQKHGRDFLLTDKIINKINSFAFETSGRPKKS